MTKARIVACDKGHTYAVIVNHPEHDGVPICPHCLVLRSNREISRGNVDNPAMGGKSGEFVD